jgi:hypothetical protein
MTLENSIYLNYSDDNMQIARCQGVCHFVVRSFYLLFKLFVPKRTHMETFEILISAGRVKNYGIVSFQTVKVSWQTCTFPLKCCAHISHAKNCLAWETVDATTY